MDTANFSQQLRVLPGLLMVLAEDSTVKFKVSPTGHLSVLRGTRWSASNTPLDVAGVRELAHEIASKPGAATLGPWFLRVLHGVDGLTIFGERRITLPADPPAEVVEEELIRQAREGSTGVIAGGLGSQKDRLLLWLASQLGRRELVLVSEVPPHEFDVPTATHVFPPSNERQRRDLQRLLRAHDCIFWAGISHPDDLTLFASAPSIHNRWLTLDADSPAAVAGRLRSLVRCRGQFAVDSCLFIDVSADGLASVAQVARHTDEGWSEVLAQQNALVEALENLGSILVKSRGPGATSASGEWSRPRMPSPQAAIVSPKQAGRNNRHESSAASSAASKPDEPTVNSTIEPLVDDIDDEPTTGGAEEPPTSRLSGDELSDRLAGDEPITGRLSGMSVDELLRSDEIEEEALLRASGEIDLRAFLRARQQRRERLEADSELDEPSSTPLDEPGAAGLERDSDSAVTGIADGEKVDAMLAKMDDEDADGPPQFPDVDPDKLTPPVRGETTALTPVDMDRIRESSDDDLSWLLDNELADDKDDNTLTDEPAPDVANHGTKPSRPSWEVPTPSEEISEAHRNGDSGGNSGEEA